MDQVNIKATFRDDDIFGRKEYANMAMQLITQHPHDRGACSIAVDAPWGMGKSTFLHMWINELDLGNPNFDAAQAMDPPYESMFAGKCVLPVYYNVWENDFCDNALIPLIFTLCAQMEKKQQDGQFLADQGDKVVSFISTCAQLLTSLTIYTTTKNSVIAEAGGAAAGLATKGILHHLTRYLDNKATIEPNETISAEYDKQLKIRQDFRDALEELATTSDGVYIFIDELDRCKPSFASETLEVIKHFFNIPNVAFVFAVDQTQLCHAIAGRYGNNMDAGGYLTKFFDYQVRLPAPTSVQLIANYRHNIPDFNQNFYLSLKDAFRACGITPREFPTIINQANTLFRLWLNNSHFGNSPLPYTVIVILFSLKLRQPQMYSRFMSKTANWDNGYWQNNHANLFNAMQLLFDNLDKPCAHLNIRFQRDLEEARSKENFNDTTALKLMFCSFFRETPPNIFFRDLLHDILEFTTPYY